MGPGVPLAGNSPTHQGLAATMLANCTKLLQAADISIELGMRSRRQCSRTGYSPNEVIITFSSRPFDRDAT